MKPDGKPRGWLAAVALVSLAVAAGARAQDEEKPEKKLGWSDTAELTLVQTTGNTETETLGLANTLVRRWQRADLRVEAGALRAETTTTTRTAIGTSPSDFRIDKVSTTELTAEKYYLRTRYDRLVSERFFWFAGAGWDRNEFAGIANRTTAVGGVGHRWLDEERARFRTDYALTYTRQEDVAGPESDFLGLRLSWDYWRKVTTTTSYASVLLLDENLDETSDYRADFTNSLAVKMSDRMAIKLSLQLLYDNDPSLVRLPLLFPDGEPTGDTVFAELDSLDSLLTVALVVDF